MSDSLDFVFPDLYHSPATYDNYVVVHSSGCSLVGMLAENTSMSNLWIQVHDGYAQPTVGAVPMISLKVAPGAQVSFDASESHKIFMHSGLVIASSTTGPTYTAPGAASVFLTVMYVY